jgi:hypothetical protein
MIVSANNISVPLIAPSVNVQTEQAAKDNKTRPAVEETHRLAKSEAEKAIDADEKRRKQSAWDPAEHPSYEEEAEPEEREEPPQNEMERLFALLSLDSYTKNKNTEYTIRFRLPKKVLDAALQEGKMAQRRTVIRYHYGHSALPNSPSYTIAVT